MDRAIPVGEMGISYLQHNIGEKRYYAELMGIKYTGVCVYWSSGLLPGVGEINGAQAMEIDFFPLPRHCVVNRLTPWENVVGDRTIARIDMYALRSFHESPKNLATDIFLSEMYRLFSTSIPTEAEAWADVFRRERTRGAGYPSPILRAVKERIDACLAALVQEGFHGESMGASLPLFGAEGFFSRRRRLSLCAERGRDDLCRLRLREIANTAIAKDVEAFVAQESPSVTPCCLSEAVPHVTKIASEIHAIILATQKGEIPVVDVRLLSVQLVLLARVVGVGINPLVPPKGTFPAVVANAEGAKSVPLLLSSGRKVVVTSKIPLLAGLAPNELKEVLVALDALVDDTRFDDVRAEITRLLAST